MEVRYFKEYSQILKKDMEYKIYGHYGKPCLVFPCQNGRFYEWEDRGMFRILEPWIQTGEIRFVCVDSIDSQSWSSDADIRHRAYMHEQWFSYILQEMLPSAEQKMQYRGTWMTTGCSMGGFHATNIYLRFPDKFDQLLALSGIYNLDPFIAGGEIDFNVYQNDPCKYMMNMDPDHEYISRYNQSQAYFVVGQGEWEYQCLDDLRRLMNILMDKNIHANYFFFDQSYPHDWPSWEKYVVEFIPKMIKK